MKLSEIYKIADALAPKALSDEYCQRYGAYDNSGALVDTGDEIVGVVFSLDLSVAAIDRAIKEKANLIVTHHPAIYGKIGSVGVFDPLGEKLVRCIKKGISVIAMHLNLDGAIGGIDESLCKGVCLAAEKTTGAGMRSTQDIKIMHPLSQGGYGRSYAVAETTLGGLEAALKNELSCRHMLVYGDKERKINRVASFCGAGVDEAAIAFAADAQADVILSSDFKHHQIALALEKGLAVLIPSHYAAENYGFEKYYEKIRRQIDIPCGYHTDEVLL